MAWATVRIIWSHPANQGRRLSTVTRYVTVRASNKVLGRRHVIPVGSRSHLWARPDEGSSAATLRAPIFDWNEMQAWRRHLRPGAIFVDVGANVGIYSIWAIEQGADVVSIEPHPFTAQVLRENLALNGYEAEIHEVAVADRKGTMHLDGPDISRQALTYSATGISVQVTTLDDIIGDRDVAGMKIDIEGSEVAALHGAARILAEHRVALVQIEWNRRAVDPVIALLAAEGFETCRPDRSGVLHVVMEPDLGTDIFARRRTS